MKEAIIILGGGVMQGPVIQAAGECGYFAIVLDGSADAPNIKMADLFEQIDLKNKEDIETFARSQKNKFGRIGIMTAGTDFSASVAWTAEKLGLPGIPYETALNASDKSRMRECFKKAGVPSPDFITITKNDLVNLVQIIKKNRWTGTRDRNLSVEVKSETPNNDNKQLLSPLVVKPVDNMGSRGCRRVDSLEELNEAAEDALSYSRSGRAIIETFMPGPEFSVDAIVYHGEITICGLADRHIFFPPYFIEMGHTIPAEITCDKEEALLGVFRDGIRALGISEEANIGAAKGDIKLTDNGNGVLTAMIGEIAARLSGGYMSGWTYPHSSGAHPVKAAVLMAMGKKPDGIIPSKNWVSAERAFIAVPGTVKKITGIEEAKKMPYVNDVFLRIAPGDKTGFPQNNVSKCGNVIASAPDRRTAVKAAEDAVRSIRIHLDPIDPETKEFSIETICKCSCSSRLKKEDNTHVELQISQNNAEIMVSTNFLETANNDNDF